MAVVEMAVPEHEVPTLSALDRFIQANTPSTASHPVHLHHLALQIQHNLQHEHRWTELTIHTTSPLPRSNTPLSRPIISGLPPKRLYIHPDEQVELLAAESARQAKSSKRKTSGSSGQETEAPSTGRSLPQPEREWVLPTHLREPWSLRRFGEIFDDIGITPPSLVTVKEGVEVLETNPWRKAKRMLLATLQDDSTVVFYIVHDGIVKPRQN